MKLLKHEKEYWARNALAKITPNVISKALAKVKWIEI